MELTCKIERQCFYQTIVLGASDVLLNPPLHKPANCCVIILATCIIRLPDHNHFWIITHSLHLEQKVIYESDTLAFIDSSPSDFRFNTRWTCFSIRSLDKKQSDKNCCLYPFNNFLNWSRHFIF